MVSLNPDGLLLIPKEITAFLDCFILTIWSAEKLNKEHQ